VGECKYDILYECNNVSVTSFNWDDKMLSLASLKQGDLAVTLWTVYFGRAQMKSRMESFSWKLLAFLWSAC
jgi:hypothetical protein